MLDRIFRFDDMKIQLLWIGIFLILYLVTKNILFGIGIFIVLIYGFYVDLKRSSQEKGVQKTLIEMFITVGLVVFATQVIGVVIGTSTSPEPVLIFPQNTFRPILSVIPSCSMEPNYRQGDVLVIGDSNNIRTITLYGEFSTNPILIYRNYTYRLGKSIWIYCQNFRDAGLCREFRREPSEFVEIYGDLRIFYDRCYRDNGTSRVEEICAMGFAVGDKKYVVDPDNGDAIVYSPNRGDSFYPYGFIIHRAQFRMCNNDNCVYFTKGDNNNIFDFQFENAPFNSSRIIGKPVLRIPYLGYVRIFLGGTPIDTKECMFVLKYQ
ncbi:MAG: hypothetical protein NZ908_01100 [Candidatus Micrarchaeota archaeon]|nr:hypothetical protein [Candidatus Micrarchaeota archaeon]